MIRWLCVRVCVRVCVCVSMTWKGLLKQYFGTSWLLCWHLWLLQLALMESVQTSVWRILELLNMLKWMTKFSRHRRGKTRSWDHTQKHTQLWQSWFAPPVIFSPTFHRSPRLGLEPHDYFLLVDGERGRSWHGLVFCCGSLRGHCSRRSVTRWRTVWPILEFLCLKNKVLW